jgi:hypothetical protein
LAGYVGAAYRRLNDSPDFANRGRSNRFSILIRGCSGTGADLVRVGGFAAVGLRRGRIAPPGPVRTAAHGRPDGRLDRVVIRSERDRPRCS